MAHNPPHDPSCEATPDYRLTLAARFEIWRTPDGERAEATLDSECVTLYRDGARVDPIVHAIVDLEAPAPWRDLDERVTVATETLVDRLGASFLCSSVAAGELAAMALEPDGRVWLESRWSVRLDPDAARVGRPALSVRVYDEDNVDLAEIHLGSSRRRPGDEPPAGPIAALLRTARAELATLLDRSLVR